MKPALAPKPAYGPPVTLLLKRMSKSREQPVALRALSKLLRAHPRAREATVVWLRKGQSSGSLLSTMRLDRAERWLHITWEGGGTRHIMTDENGVHHFAAIGRIDQFGTST